MTDSFSSLQYRSYPTSAMCPLCALPSMLPAPRISRSLIAMRKPDPSSVYSRMAESLFSAVSLSSLFLRYIRNA